jgi:hypothetical protein
VSRTPPEVERIGLCTEKGKARRLGRLVNGRSERTNCVDQVENAQNNDRDHCILFEN